MGIQFFMPTLCAFVLRHTDLPCFYLKQTKDTLGKSISENCNMLFAGYLGLKSLTEICVQLMYSRVNHNKNRRTVIMEINDFSYILFELSLDLMINTFSWYTIR